MDNYAYTDDTGKPFAITRHSSVPRPNNDYFVEVNSRSKFFKKSNIYKILTPILIVVAVLLLIAVIVLAVLYCSKYYDNRLCTSEECLRSATNLHLSIDFSLDPCDNFYEYICGRWSTEHPNHGWFASFSAFTTIYEKVIISTESFLTSEEQEGEPQPVLQAKNFYKSCMDIDAVDNIGFSAMFKYLKEVDLPAVPSLFTKSDKEIANFSFNWLKSDAVIKKKMAMDVLIGFLVDPNLYNRTENAMYIGVPMQPCPLPSPLKKAENKKRQEGGELKELRKEANRNIIEYILVSVYRNATSKEPKEKIFEEATEVLLNMTFHIDTLVGNYTEKSTDTQSTTVSDYQKKMNLLINNGQKKYPQLFENYLTYLFEGTNITLHFDKDILITDENDEDYLPKILSYVLSTSDIYLELYMWWVTVYAMIINTSSDVAEFIVKQTAPFYSGEAVLRSRSLDCSVLTNSFMGLAVSYGLADRAFSKNTQPKVEQMLYDIKDAFVEQVNSLTWMDKETKQATLEKCKEMMSFIGYPDWLFKNGSLEIFYKGIVINNDTFLDNMMNFIRKIVPSKLEVLRKPNERNWSADPLDVNAYNSFSDNSINLPMAILTFPAYNLGLEVLNYGAIGSVLGHELTHGFDNTGRKYDKMGNLKQWWSNATIQTFEEKIECLVKQYDNFTIEGVENHIQGKKTLGENIADNGGLSHAYKAYHHYLSKHGSEPKLPGFESFSNDQLFFMAFGSIWCQTISNSDLEIDVETDEHSPNRIRVIGSLQNSQEFAKAFKCPVGSKMNPNASKCKVW